jgi:hypothetical protein
MELTQAQLSELWTAARSGRPAQSPSFCPVKVISDSAAQVMSCGPGRAVYARQLGGEWTELPPPVGRGQRPSPRYVMMAHVTVDDETLTVPVGRTHQALQALQGDAVVGQSICATIRYELMSQEALATIPEFAT